MPVGIFLRHCLNPPLENTLLMLEIGELLEFFSIERSHHHKPKRLCGLGPANGLPPAKPALGFRPVLAVLGVEFQVKYLIFTNCLKRDELF